MMGDTEIEGTQSDLPLRLERHVVAEIVPVAQGQHGQIEPGASGPSVVHGAVVARRVRDMVHEDLREGCGGEVLPGRANR